jgi:CRP/FNR family transcriptional regulator, anaerobic regulatory protein
MNFSIQDLLSTSKKVIIDKGKFFIKQGQVSDEIAFVNKGSFQLVYTNKNKEWTKGFSFENDWLGSIRCISRNEPNLYSIKSLEASEISVLKFNEILENQDSDSIRLNLFLPFVTNLYLKKEEREFDFLNLSAKERYLKFIDQYQDNARRLKQNHIASYLGITNVALSRIHSKIFNLG